MFCEKKIAESKKNSNFAARFLLKGSGIQTVIVAQLVRALVCGTRGRGFDPHHSPFIKGFLEQRKPFLICEKD